MALRNLILLVTLAFLWGSSNIFIKMSVETIPPMAVSACRILTSVPCSPSRCMRTHPAKFWPRS